MFSLCRPVSGFLHVLFQVCSSVLQPCRAQPALPPAGHTPWKPSLEAAFHVQPGGFRKRCSFGRFSSKTSESVRAENKNGKGLNSVRGKSEAGLVVSVCTAAYSHRYTINRRTGSRVPKPLRHQKVSAKFHQLTKTKALRTRRTGPTRKHRKPSTLDLAPNPTGKSFCVWIKDLSR